MRDAIEIENLGIPATLIVLQGFYALAETTRELLGRSDLDYVILPGTLASPSVARTKADIAVVQAVEHLTKRRCDES